MIGGKDGRTHRKSSTFLAFRGQEQNNIGSITWELKQHINKELTELPRTGKDTELLGMNHYWMQSPTLMTFNSNAKQLRNRGGVTPGLRLAR